MIVAAILAWTALAFGGVYTRHLTAPAAACLVLLLLSRPRILSRGPARPLDRAILLVAGASVVQLIPLPRGVTRVLSPETATVVGVFSLTPSEGPLALSIDVAESALALLIFAGAAALFFAARQIFGAGGVRTVARTLAFTGLFLALIAIAQEATAPGLMYWTWRPLQEGPQPFGPFVNRNHFGTWAMLTVPLSLGYMMAHASAHHGPRGGTPWQQQLLVALDVRGFLLLAASAALIVATVLSLSRSGMFGLAVTAGCAVLLARDRLLEDTSRHVRPALFVGAAAGLSILVVALRVDPALVSTRFASAGVGFADRFLIWRDTVDVVRDFWLTGTGVGTYQVSMAVYQQTMPGVIFNQAHNHYLQVISEGGMLVGIPTALMLVMFAREARARLLADRSGMFWLRAGAASGLCGVAVQSLLETGLTTPANAALAAVAAAIVTHVPPRAVPGQER